MTNSTSTTKKFKICGWSEGYEHSTLTDIIIGDGITSEIKDNFQEVYHTSSFGEYCSKEHLERFQFTMSKIAEEMHTDRNRLLLIETQMVSIECMDFPRCMKKRTKMFRFYHSSSEGKQLTNRQHGINVFWNKGDGEERPHIFYDVTVERLTYRKNKTKAEARQIVDDFIGQIISNFDTIVDLSNARVYRRKSEIEKENLLKKLQHIDKPEFFDCNMIKQALKLYQDTNEAPFSDQVNSARIDYFNHERNSFKKLDKNNIFLGDTCHPPYITDHNMILFRAKYGRWSINFVVDILNLKQRFSQNKNIPIEQIIPILSPENISHQLLKYYLIHGKGRVTGNSINIINQPRVIKKSA